MRRYEIRDDSVYVIIPELDENGDVISETEVRCFVRIAGNTLHAMIRAKDKATFDTQAIGVGLRHINEEGVTITPRSVTITELGPYVITPAVLDENGNITQEAVLDNRYHVNFWIDLNLADPNAWMQWAPAWSMHGVPATSNKQEFALVFNGIELIDPNTVRSPSNILL